MYDSLILYITTDVLDIIIDNEKGMNGELYAIVDWSTSLSLTAYKFIFWQLRETEDLQMTSISKEMRNLMKQCANQTFL